MYCLARATIVLYSSGEVFDIIVGMGTSMGAALAQRCFQLVDIDVNPIDGAGDNVRHSDQMMDAPASQP